MRIEFQKAEVRALREARRRARLLGRQADRIRRNAERAQQSALRELLADYAGWFPEHAQLVHGVDGVPIALEWGEASAAENSQGSGRVPADGKS